MHPNKPRRKLVSFQFGSLLVHSDQVPVAARDALRAAHRGGDARGSVELLELAAQILHRDAGVDCPDARELVDLRPEDCGG